MDDRSTSVRCPCGHVFQVQAAAAQKEIACPACKKPFTPAPKTPTGKPAGAGSEHKTARRYPGVPPPPDLNVQIPGFRLDKRVGAGGRGDVYLARQGGGDGLGVEQGLPP